MSPRFVLILTFLVAVPLISVAQELKESELPDRGHGKDVESEVTKLEIDQAYMNCQIDVDKNLSGLVGKVKSKLIRVETKSQRAFCDNRKHDCKTNPRSPDCRVFVDEYKRHDMVSVDSKR